MVIGLSEVQISLESQNRTTAQRESDIVCHEYMITDRMG